MKQKKKDYLSHLFIISLTWLRLLSMMDVNMTRGLVVFVQDDTKLSCECIIKPESKTG